MARCNLTCHFGNLIKGTIDGHEIRFFNDVGIYSARISGVDLQDSRKAKLLFEKYYNIAQVQNAINVSVNIDSTREEEIADALADDLLK
jgi:hypothetical protein